METISQYAGDLALAVDRKVLWPAAEFTLGTTLGALHTCGGLVRFVPQPVRSFSRTLLLGASNALNQRVLLDPFGSVAEVLAIDAVRGRDTQEGDDLAVFFQLGVEGFASNHYGFGNTDDPQNCFFPHALVAGPQDQAAPAMTSQINLDIAKTCCLLSLLSYRSDQDIHDCMTRGRMIPNTSFFSIHTNQEGDLGVWVDHNQDWAVFCFRGTEFETARDWLTSALLNPAVAFQVGADDDGTGPKVRDRYFTQMKSAVGRKFSLQKVVTDPDHKVFPEDGVLSALGFALYLHHKGCKIYCTGHSLAGGLATLLGAYLASMGLNPAAVVSFGSPPVGDESFREWFYQAVQVSWRFVNEDEFAPMAPPIPFTEGAPAAAQELRHVHGLIRCEALGHNGDPTAPPPEAMEERILELRNDGRPFKMILDHNLAVTLRRLINFRAHLHHAPHHE